MDVMADKGKYPAPWEMAEGEDPQPTDKTTDQPAPWHIGEGSPVPEMGKELPERGLVERTGDFFAGQTPREFPDAGELGTSMIGEPFSSDVLKSWGLGLGMMFDTDDMNRVQMVKSRWPNTRTKQDRYGNWMVRVPGKLDNWTYVNRPGISPTDVFDVTSQGAQGIGAAKLAGGGRYLLSRMAKMGAAEGTLSIGQDELSYGFGGRQTALPNLGKALMAASFGMGGEVLGSIGGWGLRMIRDRRFYRNGRWTPRGREQLERLGLNPSEMTPEALESLRRQFQRHGAGGIIAQTPESARQARRVAQGEGLPVPVTQTRGQVRQDPEKGAIEDEMLKGVRGDSARQIAQTARAARSDQLSQNTAAIQSRIGGGTSPRQRGEGAATAQNKLAELKEAQYDAANRKFDEIAEGAAAAKASGRERAFMAAEDVKNIADHIRGEVRKYHAIYGEEKLGRMLKDMDAMGSGKKGRDLIGIDDLYQWRRQMSSARNNAGESGVAAGRAVKAFDDSMREAQLADLVRGDPNVIKAWREANDKWHTARQVWNNGGLVRALTSRVGPGGSGVLRMGPDEAANVLLNGRHAGIPNSLYVRELDEIRQILGPDSPEWNALREEVFMQIVRPGTRGIREGEQTIFNGTAFAREWDNAKQMHSGVVTSLFDPAERRMIDDFAEVAQRVTSPVPGAVNYSNTAISARRAGLAGKWRELSNFLALGHKASLFAKTLEPLDRSWNAGAAGRAMRGQMESPPVSHPIVAGGAAAAGAEMEEPY